MKVEEKTIIGIWPWPLHYFWNTEYLWNIKLHHLWKNHEYWTKNEDRSLKNLKNALFRKVEISDTLVKFDHFWKNERASPEILIVNILWAVVLWNNCSKQNSFILSLTGMRSVFVDIPLFSCFFSRFKLSTSYNSKTLHNLKLRYLHVLLGCQQGTECKNCIQIWLWITEIYQLRYFDTQSPLAVKAWTKLEMSLCEDQIQIRGISWLKFHNCNFIRSWWYAGHKKGVRRKKTKNKKKTEEEQ